jgi:hypothetical protein
MFTTQKLLIGALFSFTLCAWLGTLFAVDALSQWPVTNRGEQHQAHDASSADTQAAPFKVQIVPTAEQEAEAARQHAETASNEWLLVVWTALLAVFTLGLVGVVAVQARLFVVQLRLMRADIKHTEAAVKAAEAQAKTAHAALLASNRPWVFTQPWPATAEVLMNEEIHFEMEFHCYGNAPATVIELCVECSDKEPVGDAPHYTTAAVTKNIGLAPDNRWWEKDVGGVPFKTTWQRPYVFGFIRYQDQFGVHTSGYCTRLLPRARKTPNEPLIAIATAGTSAWSRFD